MSNLSFISKVIEKVVASRILDHMKENNLLDPMQSAYRSGHSTETALLWVHNDIVCAIDKGHGVFLILLDLSAAFDTVDHEIFLSFLKDYVGLHGPVLSLFETYLADRTQCVSINGVLSELSELVYGVPQGSVLDRSYFVFIQFHLEQFFDTTRFSIISMLMILSSIALLIYIHLMKLSPPFRPVFRT